MYVIAFDPGGTTGWSGYKDGVFDQGQIGPHEHHRELFEFLESTQPDVVCYEAFTYQVRGRKEGYAVAAVNLISCEYIGVIKLWHQQAGIKNELVVRHASHAKRTWTDDKLKTLGLYRPGKTHANDATRHLLAHLVVDLKMTDLLEPLRPRPTH